MLCPQNALKTQIQPSLLFQIAPWEQCVWRADADAEEVGLTPAYFYTVATGYYSS